MSTTYKAEWYIDTNRRLEVNKTLSNLVWVRSPRPVERRKERQRIQVRRAPVLPVSQTSVGPPRLKLPFVVGKSIVPGSIDTNTHTHVLDI
jgi:hypothetical protein